MACSVSSEVHSPKLSVPAGKDMAGVRILTPDGSQIAGLVITDRPETRKRGNGIIVLIDLPL